MSSGAAHDLEALLCPRTIAVVGASQRGGRAAGAVKNLLELGFAGAIYPVNPHYQQVLGLPCYPSLAAIPGRIDVVVIGIPGASALRELEAAHAKGVRAAVLFASGFAEAGQQGSAQQAELEAFARRTGMLICGPNCLGVINLQDRSCAYSSVSPKDVARGDVAVVSQSGTVIVALVKSERGIGFSHLISSGNEAALTSGDYLRYLAEHPATKVLGAFLEGIREPGRFLAAAAAARRAGKPLIVLKAGRSEQAQAASLAHTGSLAARGEVIDALFLQHGITQCADLDEWIEAIEVFRYARAPTARGVGILGVSGGENALVLDHAAALGLSIPSLSAAGRRQLQELLPWFASPQNPIDPTGAAIEDPTLYGKCLEVLAAEPEVGVIAVSQDSPAAFDLAAAQATADAARRSGKCFVYFSNVSGPYRREVQSVLRAAGVPYLQGLREALLAIKALIAYHLEPPQLQPQRRVADAARRAEARALIAAHGPLLTEDNAKRLIAPYGLPVVAEALAADAAAAVRAATRLGYPVAVKVVSPDIPHKAAVGGVRLGLTDAAAVADAYRGIMAAVSARQPAARIAGALVQPMVGGAIEAVMGLKRDPQFGMTILFGLGGVFTEALRQVAVRLVPLAEAEARAMVAAVPAVAAMLAARGGDRQGVETLVGLLLRLSQLAIELEDDIEELDLNPVIVDATTARATVVDALIVARDHEIAPAARGRQGE